MATAEVLKTISRSTFDLQAVLETLLRSAAQLCAADKGGVWQRDGELLRAVTVYGVTPEAYQYAIDHPMQLGRGSVTGRAMLEGKAVHVADVLADPEYVASGRLGKVAAYRTGLAVPLMRDGAMIGTFSVARTKVNPFTEKQIELVTTFADQAVIAIENARLLNELRQRKDDLTVSLDQQTATSEVLRVISSSAGELEAVFQSVLENATGICQAQFGTLNLYDGDAYSTVALHNPPPQFAQRL